MLSQRLTMKPQQQPQVQKIDKLTANQLLALQKLQNGQQRAAGSVSGIYEEHKEVARKERRY